MKFTLNRVDTIAKKSIDVYEVPLGQRTTGLRAHTITLDHQELCLILRYPKYGLMLSHTLYPVMKEMQQPIPENLDYVFNPTKLIDSLPDALPDGDQ